MNEERELPNPLPVHVIEIPWPPTYPIAGAFIVIVGLLFRCYARSLAWQEEWKYTGDRANTLWAFRESLYIDLSLVAMAFGLALILLYICRVTASK